jgi:hypothetical protein
MNGVIEAVKPFSIEDIPDIMVRCSLAIPRFIVQVSLDTSAQHSSHTGGERSVQLIMHDLWLAFRCHLLITTCHGQLLLVFARHARGFFFSATDCMVHTPALHLQNSSIRERGYHTSI